MNVYSCIVVLFLTLCCVKTLYCVVVIWLTDLIILLEDSIFVVIMASRFGFIRMIVNLHLPIWQKSPK